ncbi:MAG TPA: TetR/AcrR family transcriptional regulator, partial [Acidimicrobiales bacterium]|nr:TetR/AcrR family transcriptional regulator [Acidimicrobiales bacterium]
GLDLFGTQGYPSTTVDQVCRRAAVSTRNFYEEFENRMALLVAVGERIAAQAFSAFTTARPAGGRTRLHGRVTAMIHTLVDDPRVARVAFVETLAVDAVEGTRRRDLLDVFPEWIASYLEGHFDARGVPPAHRRHLAVAAFGAGLALISAWALTPADQRGDVDELVGSVVDAAAAVLGLPAGQLTWRSAPSQ